MTTPTEHHADTLLILEALHHILDGHGNDQLSSDEYRSTRYALFDEVDDRLSALRKVKPDFGDSVQEPKRDAVDQRAWPSGEYPYEPTCGPIDLALPKPAPVTATETEACPACDGTIMDSNDEYTHSRQYGCLSCGIWTTAWPTKKESIETWNRFCQRVRANKT